MPKARMMLCGDHAGAEWRDEMEGRSGTLRGRAAPDGAGKRQAERPAGAGAAARPPGGSMRAPCAGSGPACEIKVKHSCRMYDLAAQRRAAGRAFGHGRRLAPELISG